MLNDIRYSNELTDNDNTFVNVRALTLYRKILNNTQYYFPNVTSMEFIQFKTIRSFVIR